MINPIRRFFLVCSGATLSILDQDECRTERARYAMIGAFVLLTAAFASLSGGYALYTGFQSAKLAVAVGLLWGAFIFTLDRFIVSTMQKEPVDQDTSFRERAVNKLSEILFASPRLVLAIFIAMTVAVPLEIKYFEPEIKAQLADEALKHATELPPEVAKTIPEITVIENELKAMDEKEQQLTKRRDELREQQFDEIGGRKTSRSTGRPGDGPWAKKRELEANQVAKELAATLEEDKPRRAKLVATLDELRLLLNRRIETGMAAREAGNGFLARLKALSVLADKDPVKSATRFLVILLILIEITPVLIKLFASRGPYDDLLEAEEHRIQIRKKKETSDFNTEINKELESYGTTSEARRKMEEQMTRETMDLERVQILAAEKFAAAATEIASARVESWRSKELERLAKAQVARDGVGWARQTSRNNDTNQHRGQ